MLELRFLTAPVQLMSLNLHIYAAAPRDTLAAELMRHGMLGLWISKTQLH